MNKVQFELDLQVEELINIPITEENQCFLNIAVSNFKKCGAKHHKTTTGKVTIKNHKVTFGSYGNYKTTFKVNIDPKTQMLSSKYLTVEFNITNIDSTLINPRHNKNIVIGIMKINLTEHINGSEPQKIQYLLENCKVNAIAKVSLFLKHLDTDQQTLYNIPEQSNNHIYHGLKDTFEKATSSSSPPSHHSSDSNISSIPAPNRRSISTVPSSTIASTSMTKNPSTNGGATSISTHRQSTLAKAETSYVPLSMVPKSMKERALLPHTKSENSLTFDDSSTPMINKMASRSLAFSCDIAAIKYDEYTAEECINDIIHLNGNGWRRNNQGLNMIDVLHQAVVDVKNRGAYNTNQFEAPEYLYQKNDEKKGDESRKRDFINERISAFHDGLNVQPKDLTSADLFDHTQRYKPMPEHIYRDDLKSWNLK